MKHVVTVTITKSREKHSKDGEGTTKFVTVTVKVNLFYFLFDVSKQIEQGASSYKNAHNIQVASRISTSTLVKMALYGEDAKYAIRSLLLLL